MDTPRAEITVRLLGLDGTQVLGKLLRVSKGVLYLQDTRMLVHQCHRDTGKARGARSAKSIHPDDMHLLEGLDVDPQPHTKRRVSGIASHWNV